MNYPLPGPFSEHDLIQRWNAQADNANQWDSLDTCEQLAWAQTCAIETVPLAGRPFVVRHYTSDGRPCVKGNGFDGLEIGNDRQEAEEFVAWINQRPCFPATVQAERDPTESL